MKLREIDWGLVRRWAAGICVGVAGVIGLWDAVIDDARLVDQFAGQVQADFLAQVERERRAEARGERPGLNDRTIRLEYARKGSRLLSWSSNLYVPERRVAEQQLASPHSELLLDGNVAFYNVKVPTDSSVVFRLIPLKLSYPIRNDYLGDYVNLGSYDSHDEAKQAVEARYFSLLPTLQGINYTDSNGQHLCSVRIADPTPLRYGHRRWVLGLLIGALVIGLYAWRGWLRRQLRRSQPAELAFLGSLVALRALVLALGLPGSYAPVELFSPELLALDWLTPSLGDFLLNAGLASYVAQQLSRLYDHPTLSRRWVRAFAQPRNAWVALVSLSALVGLLLYLGFMGLVERLAIDSTLYYQFIDLTRIDWPVIALFLGVALLSASVFYLIYFIAGLVLEVEDITETPDWWCHGVTLLTGLMIVLITGRVIDLLLYAGLKTGLLYLRRRYRGSLQFDLAASFLVVAAFAAGTAVGIDRAEDLQRREQVVHLAHRYADPRDLITEYLFDEAANNIAEDRTLWTSDSIFADTSVQQNASQELVERLIDNHLENTFRGYTFAVYFFDGAGRRLDRLGADRSPYLQLTTQRMRAGRTLSNKLYLVPQASSITRHIYVGRFSVSSPAYGRLYLQLELHPKVSTTTKLYPQLLVDRSVQRHLELPEALTVGVYQDGTLLRKEGPDELAGQIDSTQIEAARTIVSSGGKLYYAEPLPDRGAVWVQARTAGLLDRLTSFSLITYFFLTLYGLVRLPKAVRQLIQHRRTLWEGSYVGRIQLVMGVFGFVPLLAMWAFTSPLFNRMYYDEAEAELKQDLRLVTDYLQNDTYFLLNVNTEYVWSVSADLMNRINSLSSNDLNVYKLDGSLFTTTRQYLYQAEVTSRYINPVAFASLRSPAGQAASREAVVTERIGELNFRSAYRTLVNDEGEPVGYANMPYLTRQGVLDAQVNRLTGYVVNLYVVLMLALLVSGIFISRGLTRPLRMLRQKLDATNLGLRNERLAWSSNDEIGSIIRSYNQMLAKLEASQRDLSRNEREHAWREMARQVAHEIKNPLTPMRLSIQHLLRILSQPATITEHKQAVERLSSTLLTQVDTLSNIASTFSTFATLPQEDPSNVELNHLMQEVQALYATSQEAQVTVELPERPLTVWADRELLSRALVNLVRNALQAVDEKHQSGENGVNGYANGHADDEPAGRVVLRLLHVGNSALMAIEDNGVGITPDNRDKIFQPNFSTKTAGMGLGLAITRRLIENMSGRIDFESEPGVGTTFTISLPLHANG